MKYVVLFLITSCSYSVIAQSVTEKDFSKLSWLEGSWKRTNAKPGRTASENWKKGNSNEWIGIGVSLKEQDTSFVEKLKILVKDNAIYYVADVAENKGPVYFKFTELTSDGFVCENPDHDFPRKISYKKEGNNLKATTSGDGKSIDFLFVRN
ncbi:MAG TPA: DUF6265 family protein [Cyclobacteriaceae bacterium]